MYNGMVGHAMCSMVLLLLLLKHTISSTLYLYGMCVVMMSSAEKKRQE